MVDIFYILSFKKYKGIKRNNTSTTTLKKKPKPTHKNEKKHTRKCSLDSLLQFFHLSDTRAYSSDAQFEATSYKKQKQMKKDSLSLISIYNSECDHQVMLNDSSIIVYRKAYDNDSQSSWRLSSSLTVQSEYLTAKQFASIAGIRILPEDEQDDPLPIKPHIVSHSVHLMDHIWDASFWKNPRAKRPLTTPLPPPPPPPPPHRIEPPPILYELKKNDLSQNAYIKRGRFEIHLNPNIEYNIPPPQKVIEWKRKSRPVSLMVNVQTQ